MRKIFSLAGVALVSTVLLLSGCDNAKPPAVVNGQPISQADLDRAVKSREGLHAGTGAQVSDDMLRSSVLEEMISEVLLLQGAKEAGVTVPDADVDARLKAIKLSNGEQAFNAFLDQNNYSEDRYRSLLKERMEKDKFINTMIYNSTVTDKEIKEFFKESPMPLIKPESVEVMLVEFEKKEQAEKAAAEMKKEGFEKVAARLKDEQAAFVSDYGETSPDFYKGEIGEALRVLKAGKYGGPYSGRDGFFMIKVKKRTPERPKTLKEARPEIEAMLNERRRSAAIIHWVAEKRNKSNIVRN